MKIPQEIRTIIESGCPAHLVTLNRAEALKLPRLDRSKGNNWLQGIYPGFAK